MRVTGTLQREAWLRKELPPVERVVPGVWWVPVPIPDNPLRYVLSYLIEHSSGFVLVDPGWDAPASWQALTGGLAACSGPARRGHRRARHARASQTTTGCPARCASGRARGSPCTSGRTRGSAGFGRPGQAGRDRRLPALVRRAGGARGSASRPRGRAAARRRWPARRWPGPTGCSRTATWSTCPGCGCARSGRPATRPGTCASHDETHGLLLTGDHVLPRITPNISVCDAESDAARRVPGLA